MRRIPYAPGELAPVSEPPSLAGLIAWLETQDPKGTYEWCRVDGGCLIDQYLSSIGQRNPQNYVLAQGGRHTAIAVGHPRTYGAALERALQVTKGDR